MSRVRVLLVLLLPLWILTCRPAASEEASRTDGGAFLGRVLADGSPVPARVTLAPIDNTALAELVDGAHGAERHGGLLFIAGSLHLPAGADTAKAITAESKDGRFAFRGLAPGEYRLEATTSDDTFGAISASLRVRGGIIRRDIALGTPTRRVVRGRARYADGRPYRGVIAPMHFPMVAALQGPSTATNEDGRFELKVDTGLPDGTTRIAIVRPGRVCMAWPLPEGNEPMDMVLEADSRPVRGTVVDATNKEPIGGAKVYVASAWGSVPWRCACATTDRQGRFHFPLAPKGEASLVAVAPHHGHAQIPVEGDKPVQMKLARGARLHGRVAAPPGTRLPADLRVHAWVHIAGSWPTQASRSPSADGSFDFGTMPPSGMLLYAVGGGWFAKGVADYVRERENALPSFELTPGRPQRHTLHLERAGVVLGRILDEHARPIAGAVVRLHIHHGGEETIGGRPPGTTGRKDQVACSDAEGRYRIGMLIPDVPYTLFVERAGYEDGESRPLRAASGETVAVDVRLRRRP